MSVGQFHFSRSLIAMFRVFGLGDITEVDLTKDHDPSEEHHSDEEVPYTGKHGNNRRTDLPETCDWGGPVRGDAKLIKNKKIYKI